MEYIENAHGEINGGINELNTVYNSHVKKIDTVKNWY